MLTSLARSRNASGFSLIPGVIGVFSGSKSVVGDMGEGIVSYLRFDSLGAIFRGTIFRSDGFDLVRRWEMLRGGGFGGAASK